MIRHLHGPIVGLMLTCVVLAGCHVSGSKDVTSGARSATESKRVTVGEDRSIFTLFALLNSDGYDVENQPAMHPVRTKIRTELEGRVSQGLRERIHTFFESDSDRMNPWACSVAAMATSGPPDFTPTASWSGDIINVEPFNSLGDLHGLLKEFYAQVDIPALYAEVRPEYQAYMKSYEAVINREVAAALRYCRIDDPMVIGDRKAGEQSNALVIPNLMDSYEHAFSFVLDGRFVSVEGPQPTIGYNPHEFLHSVTNPVVYSPVTHARTADISPIVEVAVRKLEESAPSDTIEPFVDECFVRALSLRYLVPGHPEELDKLTEKMMQEYRNGYILERFFWEQLPAYEASKIDLRSAWPAILAKLDAPAELARWRADATGAGP